MIKQREDAMQAEETTKQLAGARYESNMTRMVQNVAARKGSLKGKARKCMWRASCDPVLITLQSRIFIAINIHKSNGCYKKSHEICNFGLYSACVRAGSLG